MGGKVLLIGIMIMFLHGELATYVRKDYLSMLLGSHIGYICCELGLNGMVNWLHMSVRTILLCCFVVTLVT